MARLGLKHLAVLAITFTLSGLGIYNIILKATWTLTDDGVLWEDAPQGVVAARVAAGGPGDLAGVRIGDVLMGVGGDEVLTSDHLQSRLATRRPGDHITYNLLRADERRSLDVTVKPLPKGNVTLFYYLSLVGFFSLMVGTFVMMRRPGDRAALHFYAICVLFFLLYSTSFTGKLDLADWILFWTDHLAILLLPVVFLHFCLSFPEKRLVGSRSWVIPAAYMPALLLLSAAVTSQVLFLHAAGGRVLWQVTAIIDRAKPLYFAALFVVSFITLLDSYRRTRNRVARRQMKWLVWGTGVGVVPFTIFYAIPFALGREPRLAMELAASVSLAIIPLSVAYAVVKHRLMDVELIFRRSFVYILAMAVIVGIALLANELLNSLVTGDQEPHASLIAIICTVLVILLFTPIKSRIEDLMDRLVLRDRYISRRALLKLSQELNTDLDLGRMSERLLEGVGAALGVNALAVFLADTTGGFTVFRSDRKSVV